MVVDDDRNIRESIANLLADEYEVLLAEDGEQALTEIKKERLDLVLLDVRLPKIDGLEVLKIIKDSKPNLPVIIVSAVEEIKTVVTSLRSGAYHYLTKPFNVQELEIIIRQAFKEVKQENDQKQETFELPPEIEMLINEVTRKTLEKNLTLKEANRNFERELANLITEKIYSKRT